MELRAHRLLSPPPQLPRRPRALGSLLRPDENDPYELSELQRPEGRPSSQRLQNVVGQRAKGKLPPGNHRGTPRPLACLRRDDWWFSHGREQRRCRCRNREKCRKLTRRDIRLHATPPVAAPRAGRLSQALGEEELTRDFCGAGQHAPVRSCVQEPGRASGHAKGRGGRSKVELSGDAKAREFGVCTSSSLTLPFYPSLSLSPSFSLSLSLSLSVCLTPLTPHPLRRHDQGSITHLRPTFPIRRSCDISRRATT